MSEAKIEDAEIVIRIPIDSLPHAAELAWDQEYGFEQHHLTVSDKAVFAEELVDALNDESETGNTLLTDALDKAVINATDAGAFGVHHPDDDK